MDFPEIKLSEMDLLRLNHARAGDIIFLEPCDAKCLTELGFIEPNRKLDSSKHFSISQRGLLYLNYLDDQKKLDEREQNKWLRENRREWIGIIISNAMAFAALIISAISLWKQ